MLSPNDLQPRSACVWLAAVLLLAAHSARAALGDLDPTFGNGGKVMTAISSGDDTVTSVALQSDGKIVVIGYSVIGSTRDFVLVRYNANGNLDAGFGSGGKVTTDFAGGADLAIGAVVQSDGKIVAAGTADSGGANYGFGLARYNSDGSLDASFGSGGKVITATGTGGSCVALQSDGKIIVGGGSGGFLLARYNTDGSLDGTFGIGGKATTPLPSWASAGVVAVQGDGTIVAGGYSSGTYGGISYLTLVRYLPDGSLDTTGFGGTGSTFTGGGVVVDQSSAGSLHGVGVQSDGTIIVVGDIAAVSYHPDGTVAIRGFSGVGKGMTIQRDDRIIIVGQGAPTAPLDSSDFGVARFNNTGTLDSAFGNYGTTTCSFGSFDAAIAVAEQADGQIVVAGWGWDDIAHKYDFAVARFLGASAPAMPRVSATSFPSPLSFTTATLNGVVNPNGMATTAQFEYGLTTSYGSTAPVALSPADGTSEQKVTAALSGLQSGATYHFRLTATNSLGTSSTTDAAFTVPIPRPAVSTGPPTTVSARSATLNASVNPNGLATTAAFDYGIGIGSGSGGGGVGGKQGKNIMTSSAYDGAFGVMLSPNDGTTLQAVSVVWSGLTPYTTYHYRIHASNSAGTSGGSDATFTTLADIPTVAANPPSTVTGTAATFNGTVNPNGAATTAQVEYGLDASYGQAAGITLSPTNGTTTQTVSAALVGLTPHTTYHYRVTATNSVGTSDTADATFTTPNTAPVATDSSVGLATHQTVMVTLPFTTPDADGDAVTVMATSASGGAPFILGAVSGNTVAVTGSDTAAGTGTLTYTVSDGFGGTASGSVQIAVTASPNYAWRQSVFGAQAGDPAVAGDLADPNGNGVMNLLEYALGGDPLGDSTGILLTSGRDGSNHATLSFTRSVSRTDLTLTVQGADAVGGPWTDLAQSVAGGAFTLLQAGAAVVESGTGDLRGMTVSDLYAVDDPAHPTRFLRLEVAR